MEVHHHSHTARKKWTHYFWEFLMLFLAVFCGFTAENIREHGVEKHREKQYIKSLIADLKADQTSLTSHIDTVSYGALMMDSLIYDLNHPADIISHTGDVYYYGRLAPRLRPLAISNRTFEQLKNSGNFRLIHDLDISNRIMTYYEKLPVIRLLESINETEFTEYKKAASRIFDPAILISMEAPDGNIMRRNDNPSLRNLDADQLRDLAVFAVYIHGTKKGVLEAANEMKKAGALLISKLQSAYHLD